MDAGCSQRSRLGEDTWQDAGSSSIAVLSTLAGGPWLEARCGGATAGGHKSSQGRGFSEPDVVATR